MSVQEHRVPRPRQRLIAVPPEQRRRLDLPEPFDVEIRPARSRVVVAPRGELDLATTGRVEEEIDRLVAAGFDEIVLDLRKLSFMDSTGVCLIIRQAGRPDAAVRLIDGTPAVSRLFDLTSVRAELSFLAPHEVLLAR